MRSCPVVILDPGNDLDPGMGKAHEQDLVGRLVTHLAIEALEIAILHRLARSDVILAAPCEHGIAREFGAIIADDHPPLAALCYELGQLGHDTLPRGRSVRHCGQSLPGHVIDDMDYSEPRARRHLVTNEVKAPTLVC